MNIFLDILFVALVIYFVYAISRHLRLSKAAVGLINKYENDKNNPQLIDDILAAINDDLILRKIFNRHKATKRDISKLHAKLMKWGDFRKYNRYVPITSFFNVRTLEYLLEHKNDDAKALTEKMMNHFHF